MFYITDTCRKKDVKFFHYNDGLFSSWDDILMRKQEVNFFHYIKEIFGSSLFCVGKFKGSQIQWSGRNDLMIT